ncbi:hypothetical protein OHV05_24555 [Kitasatospora sp. NBC_00070]|uniref:hypothetical protein n=1 Tax=Kitasatospora sp. NBC_00070 TaxID=2975962 RepID=UPI0032551505
MDALVWAIPAALALGLLAIREPRNANAVLLEAAAFWIAITFAALPLLLTR